MDKTRKENVCLVWLAHGRLVRAKLAHLKLVLLEIFIVWLEASGEKESWNRGTHWWLLNHWSYRNDLACKYVQYIVESNFITKNVFVIFSVVELRRLSVVWGSPLFLFTVDSVVIVSWPQSTWKQVVALLEASSVPSYNVSMTWRHPISDSLVKPRLRARLYAYWRLRPEKTDSISAVLIQSFGHVSPRRQKGLVHCGSPDCFLPCFFVGSNF